MTKLVIFFQIKLESHCKNIINIFTSTFYISCWKERFSPDSYNFKFRATENIPVVHCNVSNKAVSSDRLDTHDMASFSMNVVDGLFKKSIKMMD